VGNEQVPLDLLLVVVNFRESPLIGVGAGDLEVEKALFGWLGDPVEAVVLLAERGRHQIVFFFPETLWDHKPLQRHLRRVLLPVIIISQKLRLKEGVHLLPLLLPPLTL
jgi:hypothetical protein